MQKKNTKWLVGTELNLVNRLANEMRPENKLVQFMSHVVCECSTMARIDPQHLAWTLENIIEGNPVNIINVPKSEAEMAKLALDRMLEVS
jgi:quinolinate synthase